MINKFDTVRVKNTDIIGTVTEIHGHHITVKCDTLSIPAQVFLDEELEPWGLHDGDKVRLKGTEHVGTITGKYSDHHYRAKFDVFGACAICVRDSKIERVIQSE